MVVCKWISEQYTSKPNTHVAFCFASASDLQYKSNLESLVAINMQNGASCWSIMRQLGAAYFFSVSLSAAA